MTRRENLACTFSVVSACFLTGVLIPNISDAMTVIGATSNPTVGFCLPIIFWLKIDNRPTWSIQRVVAHTVNLLMICVGICSLTTFTMSKLDK